MSLLSKLFGSKSQAKEVAPELYKGFAIFPTPMKAEGGYRIAARIEKEISGALKVHNLVRADTIADLDEVNLASIAKCKVFIDQMGDRIFD